MIYEKESCSYIEKASHEMALKYAESIHSSLYVHNIHKIEMSSLTYCSSCARASGQCIVYLYKCKKRISLIKVY